MKFIDYLPEFIREYLLEKRREKICAKAYNLAQQEKYAEAAEVYVRFAPELLEYRQTGYGKLMYCVYCSYAFEMWIKAKDVKNALLQARNTLRILSSNDGEWLKYASGQQADNLLKMVVTLYGEGYIAEADTLSNEVNGQLAKYQVPLRCAAAPAHRIKFPSLCPHCGGKLPYSPSRFAIECPFCDTTIYAQKQ